VLKTEVQPQKPMLSPQTLSPFTEANTPKYVPHNVKKNPADMNFFDFEGFTIQGQYFTRMGDLCKGKKAVLIVNVASDCELSDTNYKQLVQIKNDNPDIEIIAYPCNQGGGMEKGKAKEIIMF
jgi:hypothetical protein